MPPIHPQSFTPQDMPTLHAATCLLMTRFITGHHCPKLAHVIVHQLQRLLEHPSTQQLPDSRNMYLQLLEHWQKLSSNLTAQHRQADAKIYH